MRVGFAIVLAVVMFGLGAWWAYRSGQPTQPPVPVRPERRERPPRMRSMDGGTRVQAGCELLAHSIKAAISRGGAVPAETKLLRLELDESGRCIIELSREFLEVNSRGSTGESEAQNALRKALAGFGRVKTLTVYVDGAIFEGSHSGEWDEIPVGSSAPSGAEP